MIVASLLLVIAAAVTLLVGLLNRDVIEWVYASIACCLLAGLLLTIGVLRSRPSRKPVLQSGGDGQGASWAGASQWGGAAGAEGSAAVLTRDDEDPADATSQVGDADLTGDDEPTRTGLPTATGDHADAAWAPGTDDDDTGEVRVIDPPAAPEPPADAVPAAPAGAPVDTPAAPDDDIVVVPKPSARGGDSDAAPASQPAAAASAADAGAAATPAARPAKATTDDAARFEQVLSPIPGVGAAKRAALFQHFGTYRKLRAATPEKLAEVPGVSRTLAERIHTTLHGK